MKNTQKYSLLFTILTIGSMGTGLANDTDSGNQPEKQSSVQKAWECVKNHKGKIIAAGCTIAAIGLGYCYRNEIRNLLRFDNLKVIESEGLTAPERRAIPKYKVFEDINDITKIYNLEPIENEIIEALNKKNNVMRLANEINQRQEESSIQPNNPLYENFKNAEDDFCTFAKPLRNSLKKLESQNHNYKSKNDILNKLAFNIENGLFCVKAPNENKTPWHIDHMWLLSDDMPSGRCYHTNRFLDEHARIRKAKERENLYKNLQF